MAIPLAGSQGWQNAPSLLEESSPAPVLLLEDDPVSAQAVRACIDAAGLVNPVVVIPNGIDAIRFFRGEGQFRDRNRFPLPVVAVIDLELPGAGGLEILAAMRDDRDTASIPSIVLSGSSRADDIDRAYVLGARSYLVKPVAFEALVDVISSLRTKWMILGRPGARIAHRPVRLVPLQRHATTAEHVNPFEARVLEIDLRHAIAEGRLEVHYQPIVDLESRRTHTLEALVRWRLPHGLLLPTSFIPIAERSELINDLGRFVLRRACMQLRRWRDDGVVSDDVKMSVNLSTTQLMFDGFVEDVVEALAEIKLPPSALVLEVTEGAMAESDGSIGRLTQLRGLGIEIAIDDFGTEYSTIARLQALPVDWAKIDKSLIAGLGDDPYQWAVANAIMRLLEAAGLRVIAEGIERADQLAHLRALGCGMGQGFHFARPAPSGEAAAYLSDATLPLPVP